MRQISFLIKPASSLCNLACSYCFYADVSSLRECASMGIMQETTMKALIDRALATPVEQVNFCFQGGEPLMAGYAYFDAFTRYVDEKNSDKKVTYAIQTNATLIDDDYIAIFKKYHFLVGVSLDGFLENHNRFRKDRKKKGTFQTVIHAIKKLEKENIEYNVLTVLTHELAKNPKQLFAFFEKQAFRYVQLIPCLPTLEGNPVLDRYCLTPKDFSMFYKTFFDLWYDAYQKGRYLSVTLFDNVIPMYRNIAPQQCGMLGKCQIQFVVEGNGNVYPCDFYVLDEYCCGNVVTDSIEKMMASAMAKRFLNEKRTYCKECEKCPFYHMCFGNCRRLSSCYYDENYCGYKEFLTYSQERMYKIAAQLNH